MQQKQADWDATEHEKVYEVVAANVQGNIEEERKKQSRLRDKKYKKQLER